MKKIPGPLWVSIVSLGTMVLAKFVPAIAGHPLLFIDVFLSAALLYGLVNGHRWAYVATIVAVALGTFVGLRQSLQAGMTILLLDCLVLVPVLICTRYFFPAHPEDLHSRT